MPFCNKLEGLGAEPWRDAASRSLQGQWPQAGFPRNPQQTDGDSNALFVPCILDENLRMNALLAYASRLQRHETRALESHYVFQQLFG